MKTNTKKINSLMIAMLMLLTIVSMLTVTMKADEGTIESFDTMPFKYAEQSVIWYNDSFYLFSGYNASLADYIYGESHRYIPATKTWISIPSGLPSGDYDATTTLDTTHTMLGEDCVWVYGGGLLDGKIYCFTFSNETMWDTGMNLSTPVRQCGGHGVIYGGKCYAFGGVVSPGTMTGDVQYFNYSDNSTGVDYVLTAGDPFNTTALGYMQASYDPTNHIVLLVGGYGNGNVAENVVIAYCFTNNTDWLVGTLEDTTTTISNSVVFDYNSGNFILFGGWNAYTGKIYKINPSVPPYISHINDFDHELTWMGTCFAPFEGYYYTFLFGGYYNTVDYIYDIQLFNLSRAGWQHRKLITIDHTKIIENVSNFPFLIYESSDSDLANYAQSDGDDILFVDYNDNITKLSHEIEAYNSSTGELTVWVKIPYLSSNVDTKIWLYYGNGLCDNQQDATNVWDSDYVSVFHMKDNTSSTVADSTSYGHTGTKTDAEQPIQVTSKIGYGQSGDGIDDYITIPTSLDYNIPSGQISIWFNFNSFSTANYYFIMNKISGTSSNGDWGATMYPGGYFRFYVKAGGSWKYAQADITGNDWATDCWYHLTCQNGVGGLKMWINNTLQSGTDATTQAMGGNSPIYFMTNSDISPISDCKVDEVRISRIQRSSGWLNLSYDNQNDPASFIDIGSDETGYNVPPSLGVPSPVNNSINEPLSFTWSILISDIDGDAFNWSIECSNGQNNSATNASDGTKSLSLSGLSLAERYTIYVNSTDYDGSSTEAVFYFTTRYVLDTQNIVWTESYNGDRLVLQDLIVFNGKLYASEGSESDDTAGTVRVFDGESWNLSKSGNGDWAYEFAEYNGKLYVGGGYSLGYGNVSVFDGESWNLSATLYASGIYCLQTYKGKLYAGGATDIDALEPTYDGDVFVFDDSEWNVTLNTTLQRVCSMKVYNDNLYALIADPTDTNNQAKIYVFDGESWNISKEYSYGTDGLEFMEVYNNKLYSGLGGDLYTFDGNEWSLLFTTSKQMIIPLCNYKNLLFISYGLEDGDGDIWIYDSRNLNVSYSTGYYRGIFPGCVYNDDLYVGMIASSEVLKGSYPNKPLTFGNPSPINGSTNQNSSFTWNIPINDPDGDLFNWSIRCSNGQGSSANGESNGTKTLSLSGLNLNATYTIWVNATDYGSEEWVRKSYIFTTSGITVPNVTTNDVTEIGTTTVTLNGYLNDDGNASCIVWFEWGLTTEYGNSTVNQTVDEGQDFDTFLSSLSPSTIYHYCAVADNGYYIGYGEDVSFTTSATPVPSETTNFLLEALPMLIAIILIITIFGMLLTSTLTVEGLLALFTTIVFILMIIMLTTELI